MSAADPPYVDSPRPYGRGASMTTHAPSARSSVGPRADARGTTLLEGGLLASRAVQENLRQQIFCGMAAQGKRSEVTTRRTRLTK